MNERASFAARKINSIDVLAAKQISHVHRKNFGVPGGKKSFACI
jgi:hypothetical protein